MIRRLSYLAFALLAFCTTLNAQPPVVQARVARVENGLVPPVLVKGGKTWNILERMKFYNVPGVSVAVFSDNRVQWARGYGVMDAETDNPVTEQTLFVAGSISKPVAIMGALRLVEEKKLSLDGNINDYLTSWKLPENDFTKASNVTLRLLASHNAGTTVHGFRGYAPGEIVPTIVQVLDGLSPANSQPVRVNLEPGTRWRYSGGGTTIVQLAMSDVEKRPFTEIMRTKVLEPIGMTSSSYEQVLSSERLALAASGHHDGGAVIQGKRFVYPEMAAAGLWTTPTDLAKFVIEAGLSARGTSNKVLSTAMARLMVIPRMATAEIDSMALGFFIGRHGTSAYFGHGGADEGFVAQVIAHREGGYGAAVMTNSDGRPMPLIREILRSIAAEYGWDGYLPAPVDVISLDPATLDKDSGRYRLGSDNVLAVRRDGDHLMAQESGGGEFTLLPISATEFIRTDREARYSFPSEGEHAGSLVILAPERAATAPRMVDASLVPIEHLRQGKFSEASEGYRSIRKSNAKDEAVNEDRLNNLGYEFLAEKKHDAAIALFMLNAEFYPESWNVYDSLAEGYMTRGDRELAIENYGRSLRLNPKNTNGERMLERLKGMK
jgi:CubicO group peptidase (beta-lactamase class C family)